MNRVSLPTENDPIRIIHGDNLMVMQQMEAKSVDHFVSDPPYGTGAVKNTFQDEYGRRDFEAETHCWASEAYRITKPGAG